MGERLFGIETEYAVAALDARGARVDQGRLLDGLMRRARLALPHLPDGLSHGMFLTNAARFYVDCGGHPEFTTPECSNPWDVVRYVRAGEAILLRLTEEGTEPRGHGRMEFFRCNVDYSGTCSTWGCHESYMHRIDPEALAPEIIPHLVSRLVYTGAGGFVNVSRGVEFTLSPRTAHIATEISNDSTGNRGIFHDKREALAGHGYRRLHVLCGETLCSDLSIWLRAGATALVVAMCEAGLAPGQGVRLRNPVAAMRRFAADPTCRATAETSAGTHLTAIDIQRHYLLQAEAHAREAFMPPWAETVCHRWRATLDALDDGWEGVATTLDWAIKYGLYGDHVRRRGMTWESLGTWSAVAERLSAALARVKRGHREPRAAIVLADDSPVAAEVGTLTGVVERSGLRWTGLDPFLDARNALFEIDTRFGQLGPRGVFSALDAAGALTHHVDGIDNIAHAVEHPPEVARARIRGRLVREFAGNGGRFSCDWDGVWDCEEGRCVDLSDPFAAGAEWQAWPGEGAMTPPRGFAGHMEERQRLARARSRGHGAPPEDVAAVPSLPDPIDLNRAALEHRKLDRLDEAERLLRQAIEVEDRLVTPDSPKRPHRRNNLAIVLMRAGKLIEARLVNAEAWRLKAGQHDLTSGRILFVRIALARLLSDRDGNTGLYVGQLKTLLSQPSLRCLGDIMATWDIPDVLSMLCERLRPGDAELLIQVAGALNDRTLVATLNRLSGWNGPAAVPLDAPWPEE